MYLYHFFTLLLLAHLGKAGPLVVLVGMAADAITEVAVGAAGAAEGAAYAGELAAETVYSSTTAAAFGIIYDSVWYGDYIIVNGALYWGSTAAVGGTLAAEGGVAAGTYVAITDTKQSKSILASISSEVKASASSHSVQEAEGATTVASMLAYDNSYAADQSTRNPKDGPLPFTFVQDGTVFHATETTTYSKSPQPPPSGAATTPIPPPPGTPVATLSPAQRPSEVPAGVPEFNFRMCQYDLIKMGQLNQSLVFDIPKGTQNVRVDNIPPTCMVLSQVSVGNPALGPHPLPMGSASLQWNNMNQDGINFVRKAFGLPPINSTTPASATGK